MSWRCFRSFSYRVLEETSTSRLEVSRSRFEATASRVATVEMANERVDEARALHPKASHVAFAYVLASGEKRYSDDGEPSGTAGAPILAALESNDLKDACLSVVRYYGGTKLGKGGLSRAYGSVARLSIQQAITSLYVEKKRIWIRLPSSDVSALRLCADRHDATFDPSSGEYLDDGSFLAKVDLEAEGMDPFLRSLKDITRGRAKASFQEEK